ncbi:MAG: hypothetical protein ACKPKO_23690, partial [Candidatus Fonsibacter sp.]
MSHTQTSTIVMCITKKEIHGIDNILGSGIFAATRGSFTYLQASGSSYLRRTTPLVQCIYLGQVST